MKASHVVIVLVIVLLAVITLGVWSGVLNTDPMTRSLTINPDRIPDNLRLQVKGDQTGCKRVRIIRPNVNPESPDITLMFRDIGTATATTQIARCNPEGTGTIIKIESVPKLGVRVRVTTVKGIATVMLPNAYLNGSVDQVVCGVPGDAVKHRKYATSWADGLPNEIRMSELSSYNKEAADHGCSAALQSQKKGNK